MKTIKQYVGGIIKNMWKFTKDFIIENGIKVAKDSIWETIAINNDNIWLRLDNVKDVEIVIPMDDIREYAKEVTHGI